MGNHKLKWTKEEEDALVTGVEKHGIGKWMNILADPQFGPLLKTRTNVDLKDKWRNMNVPSGSRLPRLKKATSALAVVPPLSATSSEVASQSDDHDVKSFTSYNTMVFEALSTLKDTNGSDLDAIVTFIEEKHQVPPYFRRALTSRLRALVNQGKIEKVQNRYKIKKEASLTKKLPSLKQKDVGPQQQSPVPDDMTSNVADTDTAIYLLADADNKACELSEAVEEMEKLSLMAEENDAMMRLAEHLYRECARGAVFYCD